GTGVLHCKQCLKLWQRDINAAINRMAISPAVWYGAGRPDVFKPAKKKKVSP
ncbi:hypothetical protein BDF20DRAFT_869562, partial [Mycotypha africana]|uniref:uncharacterized protein n=1 Tax=Mycotypha africana TaxID=64632 RepID=UPI0022FFFB54